MNESQVLPADQIVVLARLLVGGLKGATRAQLSKDVGPLLGPGPAEALERALGLTIEAGLVQRDPKAKAGRFWLAEPGRRRVLGLLDLDALPPRTTWAKLRSNQLTALASRPGPPPSGEAARRFATKGGFEAVLLVAAHQLPLSGVPTAKQATDALLWKLLGISTSEPFTLPAVKRRLLAREAGGAALDEKKALRRIVVKSAGADRDAPAALRVAVLRRWLAAVETTEGEPRPTVLGDYPQPDPVPGGRTFDLPSFASEVARVAAVCPTGRFGASRVFIVHVWRCLRNRPGYERIELDEFKRRLLEANQARLLDLGRADLVEAMDPEDVRVSETNHLGATFHFVRVGRAQP